MLTWRANSESDLAAYHLWRAESSDVLSDVRRIAPMAVIIPSANAVVETYSDTELPAGKTYYYRVAAVDTSGNFSEPSPIYAARPVDTAAPAPPIWRGARWNDDASAVLLRWTLTDESHETLIQRSSSESGGIWFSVTPWLPSGAQTYADITAAANADNVYRLRVRSASGNLSVEYSEIKVNALTGGAI